MTSVGASAFKRFGRAGHLVRFVQKDNVHSLLQQLIFSFGFLQRLVRNQSCTREDDWNCDCSENLGKAFCLFPGIATCHDTPLSIGSATVGYMLHVYMRLPVTTVTLPCDGGHAFKLFSLAGPGTC